MRGTVRQRQLSTAAGKQKLFFPDLLEPRLHCPKDSPGNTCLGSARPSTGSLSRKRSWGPNHPKVTEESPEKHQT